MEEASSLMHQAWGKASINLWAVRVEEELTHSDLEKVTQVQSVPAPS